ncbi:MoaD/ThiS family protein [Fulvivirga sedimenti]|uniref:MoaD/ThiS family protein n=1 Tax=Fulvivirga sedimenti TaxID=2879465 RepID=A0A9X1KX19_9BACT|nr:MoaD/ThiS family protein [Fulvivirga sedimenti]MCA6075686.1 MoaD/ThiS family protein [Fulvivirga sedimenti]MCA6076814.1 MoaD/ThiS family protein [Fulvivirga sedimenti]
MATVKFTSALNRFFPDLKELQVEAGNVSDVITKAEEIYPGIRAYLLEEDGSLRKHVNIFIDEDLIHDRNKLSDPVRPANEVLIFQALSGG